MGGVPHSVEIESMKFLRSELQKKR